MHSLMKRSIITLMLTTSILSASQLDAAAKTAPTAKATVSTTANKTTASKTKTTKTTATAKTTKSNMAKTNTAAKSSTTTVKANNVKKSTIVYKKTRYTRKKVSIRMKPSKHSTKIITVKMNKRLKAGKSKNGWSPVKVDNQIEGYVKTHHLGKKKIKKWHGRKLNKSNGVVRGPSGEHETYYNLRMKRVVKNMKKYGYSKKDYKVRKDGVKTLDGYVMIATDWGKYPRGTFVNTTLGLGLVCDQCPSGGIDIAVNW